MQRHFETDLKNLKQKILVMGGNVESAINNALQSLFQGQETCAKTVFELEARINQEHKEVDESCIQVLARQSPLAADLRFVIAALKISTDLERMGDQAVNITHNTRDLLSNHPKMDIHPYISAMTVKVKDMVKSALDAFVSDNQEAARKVLMEDDQVDHLKNKIFHELIETMRENPQLVESCLDQILIARNLERIGDHATNIAEDVIFVATGDDVRHGARN